MAFSARGKQPVAALLLLASVCAQANEDDPQAGPVTAPTGAVAATSQVANAGTSTSPDPNQPGDPNNPSDPGDPNEPVDPNDPALSAAADTAATTAPQATSEVAAEKATAPVDSAAKTSATAAAATQDQSTAAAAQTMSMAQVIALLQAQQKDLEEQKRLLHAQSSEIKSLKAELDVLRAPPPSQDAELVAKAETATQPLSQDKLAETSESPEDQATREEKRQQGKEAVARAQSDDPTRDLLNEFPGAWRLPGTDAALAIGGYVKTTVVYNFDPLEIRDRFIVGSIPVDDRADIEAQSSITASQSRLNFDLREPTEFGLLRAFIEGDFASDNDTFRLRHAFGQWKKVLAGKTWSSFVDTQATPEEVDFEGLNGRINVRQSQIRIMPTIGQNYEFQLSLEDPNPQIENGQGVTRAPDIVTSGRFVINDRLHVKVGLMGRQIRGQADVSLGGGLEKEYGWGATVSGRFMTPRLGERDSILFQINAGNGIGRYVNDLSSVGNFDGIFSPEGELKLFDITSGYVSYQHWWKGSVRSNFTFGAVEVDNPSFVEGDAYKRTLRFSSNIFWMPTPRIDIGAEYLWGNRQNEDGENDDATQIQLAARYRF